MLHVLSLSLCIPLSVSLIQTHLFFYLHDPSLSCLTCDYVSVHNHRVFTDAVECG